MRSVLADSVVDPHAWVVHQLGLRVVTGKANAELSLLAPQRRLADAPDRVAEATDVGEDRSPQGHVATDEVAHRADGGGLPGVAAADDPVELGGHPRRTRL